MIKIIIITYFIFISYLIAGLSTTDIRRLLKGAKYEINMSNCYCENCGHIIPLTNQLPIFSHILNKGKCKYCGNKISPLQFFQEIFIFVCALGISARFNFGMLALIGVLIFYEVFKVIMITVLGHRKDKFKSQFMISLLINICIFLVFFVFLYVFQWIVVLSLHT